MISHKFTKNGLRLLLHIGLMLVAIVFVFPFYWVLLSSFREIWDIFTLPPDLIPRNFTLDNYVNLVNTVPLWRSFFNSAYVSLSYMFLVLFFSSLAGFAFSKYNFAGRDFFFLLMLASMMIPRQMQVIPLFIIMTRIGWIDTYSALILPFAAPPFGIFLMRQYIQGSIPDELLEAAKIDGCSDFRLYRSVVLPVVTPGLASLGILMFLLNWNEFMWPLVVVQSQEMFTIPLMLSMLRYYGDAMLSWPMLLAGTVIATVPMLIVFLAFQKYFVSGLTAGAVKS